VSEGFEGWYSCVGGIDLGTFLGTVSLYIIVLNSLVIVGVTTVIHDRTMRRNQVLVALVQLRMLFLPVVAPLKHFKTG
jgi:hypothetical protein